MMVSTKSGDPYRPAREDYATVAHRLVEAHPDRVQAVLAGNRDALVGLLMLASSVSWQGRAEILGTIAEVADATHAFADGVADCYSNGSPPSDRLCDEGYAAAD